LPGLAISIGVLGLGFFAAWRVKRYNPRLALCLTAALAGGTVSAQFSSPVVVTQVYPLALVAMLCAAVSSENQSHREPITLWKVPLALAGAGFLLFAAALTISDYLAGSLKRSLESAAIEDAVLRYRRATSASLPGFVPDLYASRSFAKLGLENGAPLSRALAWQTALEAGRRAVQTSEDRQNAFFSLAQLCARQDDIGGTEDNLRRAIQAAPNWFKPHWILAELLLRTGRILEAREQARLAWILDAGKDPEVVHTWQVLGSPGSPR